MVSFLASFLCKRSFEASYIVVMMNLESLSMSTVCNLVLLAFDFFCNVGFVGDNFLLLDGSTASGGFCCGVTSPCLC
jgi:hypothetical protein